MTVSGRSLNLAPFIDIFLDLLTGNRINRPSLQGSVFWMAPEVVKQTGHTRKADIWSVGCLVVEMLTGEHPWAQLTQMQAIFKVIDFLKISVFGPNVFQIPDRFFRTTYHSLRHICRCPRLLTQNFRDQS